jgi:hypothetical protein
MARDPKVVSIAGVQQDKLAAQVAELRGLLPARIEYQRIMARLQRSAFDAYLAEGFTPEQALELCKALKL